MSGSQVAYYADLMGQATYATGGVHFDGATDVESTGGFSCTDNATVSWSVWFQCSDASNVPALWVGHEAGPTCIVNINNTTGIVPSFTSDGAAHVTAHTGDVVDTSWHHSLGSADVSTAALKIYIDGVDATAGLSGVSGAGNLTMNGHRVRVGIDTGASAFYTGNMAQLWVAPGVSLLSAGDIPPATLAKFYSAGRPVNLGTTGALPTGTPPALFLDRVVGAAASTFGTNRGTGGTFTTIGALTNAPSDP